MNEQCIFTIGGNLKMPRNTMALKMRENNMTGSDLLKCYHKKQINPPYPVFIFRDDSGLVLGEFNPMLGDDAWAGNDEDSILSKEIACWYISWDAQDTDRGQYWSLSKHTAGKWN